MFKTKLRAILRALEFGNVKIMFPLITNIRELMKARNIFNDICRQLEEEGVNFNPKMPFGIMVETPAAALTVRTLAKHVDFFSLGTNDLTQYVLAVDRGNAMVADLFSSAEPSVLCLIKNVIKQANECDIELSVCGEMASNSRYVMLLLDMESEKTITNYLIEKSGPICS